jgi:molybdopterin molybdotransferase
MTADTGRAAPAGPAAGLQPVEEYLADALAVIRPLPPAELPLAEAAGAVLAGDVRASSPLPPFDNSAMDGYAVRVADVSAAGPDRPVTLPVAGEVTAGDTREVDVRPGSCVKIMTGALLPRGADAVVPVEWTDGGDRRVAIGRAPEPGNAIRRAGGDASPGDLLLPAGTPLGPAQIGLLAAAGQGSVVARPRPRVTVFSTGNELTEPGMPVRPGQIWESNGYMLAAAARAAGCPARRIIVGDEPAAVLAALRGAVAESDLLVTSGGVSMGGEHDVVKAALSRLGSVSFRKVAMQPGMPQGFGTLGDPPVPVFTLPGNPVSAYVSFILFVRPALDVLQDHGVVRAPVVSAALTADVRSPGGKRSFLRGILDRSGGTVTPVTGQQSHQLASLARANALIIVPEPVTAVSRGDTVDVLELP